jgi:hypothetical protein
MSFSRALSNVNGFCLYLVLCPIWQFINGSQHYLTFNISPCLIREVRKKNDFFSKERKKQEPYPPQRYINQK